MQNGMISIQLLLGISIKTDLKTFEDARIESVIVREIQWKPFSMARHFELIDFSAT